MHGGGQKTWVLVKVGVKQREKEEAQGGGLQRLHLPVGRGGDWKKFSTWPRDLQGKKGGKLTKLNFRGAQGAKKKK